MIAIGQQWVSPNGAVYTITGKLRRGWEVAVTTDDGVVTASDGAFRFHDHKFRNLIVESKLQLYDPSEALDAIAEELEHKGLKMTAARIDSISREFVEARPPSEVTRQRRDDMQEQVDTIIEKMEDAEDPENIEQLQEELEDTLQDLESVDDRTAPPNKIAPVDTTRKGENIGDPDPISKS